MKTKLSPSLVGLFVLGALLLLAGLRVVTFSNVNLFTNPQRFVGFGPCVARGLTAATPAHPACARARVV